MITFFECGVNKNGQTYWINNGHLDVDIDTDLML